MVYRDGISEGQFSEVLDKELAQLKNAVELVGGVDPNTGESTIKIALTVCTKRHNLRLFSETTPGTVRNVVAGTVVDSVGGTSTVVSNILNEFYLCSHETIQGTAKPCRYTLLYDEIGFKMSELEMLTYWSTYLYCRCDRSVSYATPAYYAHWAAQRAQVLTKHLVGDAVNLSLREVTDLYARDPYDASMFFI